MTEQELRDEFEHEAWCDTQNNISKICNCMMGYPLEVIENLQETIKAKDAEIENLIKEAKKELSEKDKTIAHLSSECTRLFDPTRKFWNDERDKAITEARELIEKLSFYTKRVCGENRLDLDLKREYLEKAKAWLEKAERLIEEKMIIDSCGFDVASETKAELETILLCNDMEARQYFKDKQSGDR